MHPILQSTKIIRHFNRAATRYDQFAILAQEVGKCMLTRMGLIRIQPNIILDLGCGTGWFLPALKKMYPAAQIFGLDIAINMLTMAKQHKRWLQKPPLVAGDTEKLPLADNTIDFIFSNLMLPWCTNMGEIARELYRVLKPGGLLMFTTFGPDTLQELRASWASVDQHSHVHPFSDMHDVGDALLHAQLLDPVMDSEYFTLTYPTPEKLLHELKATGTTNAHIACPPGLTGKAKFQRCLTYYEQFRRHDKLIPATFEVVYGHAWKSSATNQKLASAEVTISLAQIKTKKT